MENPRTSQDEDSEISYSNEHMKVGSPQMRPQSERKKKKKRKTRILAIGVSALAMCLVAGGAYAYANKSDVNYRTALATIGSVEQTTDVTGTVSAVSQAQAKFSASGTVNTVDVAVGDEVSAGQVLATLDLDALNDAVTDAQDTLSQAESQLESDLETQANGTSSQTSGSSSASSSSSGGSTSGAASGGTAAQGGSTSSGSQSTQLGNAGTSTGANTEQSAGTNAGSSDSGNANSDAKKTAQQEVQTAQKALLAAVSQVNTALEQSNELINTSATSSESVTNSDSSQSCAQFLAVMSVTDDDATEDDDGSAQDAQEEDETQSVEENLDTNEETESQDTQTAQTLLVECQASIQVAQSNLTAAQVAVQNVSQLQSDVLTKSDALNTAVSKLTALYQESGTSGSGGSSQSTNSGSSEGGSSVNSSGVPSADASSSAESANSSAASAGVGAQSSTANSGGSGSSSASGSGSATNSTVTAETIVADQAQINLAQSKLEVAQSAVKHYQMTAPISGTVSEITVTAGSQLDATSTSSYILIVNENGQYVIESTVSLSKVMDLEVGQELTASFVAYDGEIDGSVSSIGFVNTSTTSTPTYSVSLTLDETDAVLPEGASATATILVAQYDDVLVVPSSAVTRDGQASTVQVLTDGKNSSSTEVVLGAIGSEYTQITDGLVEGQEVILADLNQSITSEDDSSESGLSGLTSSTTNSGTDSRREMPNGGFSGGGPNM